MAETKTEAGITAVPPLSGAPGNTYITFPSFLVGHGSSTVDDFIELANVATVAFI